VNRSAAPPYIEAVKGSGQRRTRVAWLTAAMLAACSDAPSEPGLHFETDLADVGRMYSGPSVALEFPFVNGPVPVEIGEMVTSCGCLDPQIWIGDRLLRVPGVVPAGAHGVLRTEYRTEGFSGRKQSGVTLRGAGPGLPIVLRVDSILDTWIQADPKILRFGVVDGLSEQSQRVIVRGPEPFRLSAPLADSPGVIVRGAPSAGLALEHEIEIALEASEEEGPHAAFVNLSSDNGWSVRLPVSWEIAGPLYVIPHKLLMLGRVNPGVAVSAAIEVGVREGTLELPEVVVDGLEGVQTSVRALEALSRYRIDLSLPDDLPPGKFSGWVRILLRHRLNGEVKEIKREVHLLGVVQAE